MKLVKDTNFEKEIKKISDKEMIGSFASVRSAPFSIVPVRSLPFKSTPSRLT